MVREVLTKTVSQKVRSTFRKSLRSDLKTLQIVPLHCGLSLLVVCRSGIWLENSLTLTTPAQPLLREHSLLFILPVCVMSLDSFSVFCGCSLTLRVVLFGPLTTSISVSRNLKLSTHSPLQKGHVHEYHKLVCITFSTKSY